MVKARLSFVACTSGISIEGGVDTKQQEVRISEVIEGGVAHEDGFLQVSSRIGD